MRRPFSGLALATMALVLAASAADAAGYVATPAWQRIGLAGTTVEIQAPTNGPQLTITTSTGAPADNSGINIGGLDNTRRMVLTQDLYARCSPDATGSCSGVINVISGFTTSPFSGGPVSPSNPLPTISVPGTAAEASAAPQSVGALNLIETVQASGARRGWWFFQNQSAATLYVALDDGAGSALSVFVAPTGGSAGAAGFSMGSADSGPHTGRIRVYGPANSQHALRVQ